jgi:hypothetical protein
MHLKREWSPFGEFLVAIEVLDRFQLFRTLQLQDRMPGSRLGECAVALGFVPADAIEQLYARFTQLDHAEYVATGTFYRD